MIPESHYHWQWVDTPFGGRNINIFEGRNHIATAFTEAATKKLITALRHSNTTTIEQDKVLDELVKMVSKRCGCNQDIEHADIPIIHVDELAEIITEIRTAAKGDQDDQISPNEELELEHQGGE